MLEKIVLDKLSLGKPQKTKEGFLLVPARMSRCGVFEYQNADGSVRRELRHPRDVFAKESLDTLENKPLTQLHPDELLNSENVKKEIRGFIRDVKTTTPYIDANLFVYDNEAINNIINKNLMEISLGYERDLIPERGIYDGIPYDFKQTNIRYNHASIVEFGRAGPQCKVLMDSIGKLINTPEGSKMGKLTINSVEVEVDEGIATLIIQERDGANKRIKELEQRLETTGTTLDCLKEEITVSKKALDDAKKIAFDEDKISVAVEERISILNIGSKVLDAKIEDLKTKKNIDIKKEIIKKRYPSVAFDSISSEKLEGYFEAITLMLNTDAGKGVTDAAEKIRAGGVKDTSENTGFKAREKAIERSAQAWKSTSSETK